VEAVLGPDLAWREATNRKGSMEPIQLTLAPQDDFLLATGVCHGFGAEVASNRGLTSKTFSESQSALNWLRAFGPKAQGS
jgi:hypothetical protein